MRVGIGAVLAATGGPARYAQELVRALGALPRAAQEYVVLTNRPELFASAPAVTLFPVPLPSPLLEPLWDHVLLPIALRRAGVDVYHGVKGALPLSIRAAQLVTIHDLAIYAYPETFAWQQHLHMRPHLRLAARRARRVIADSEHARGDIVRRLGVAADRVVAVPLGVRTDLFRPAPGPADGEVASQLELPQRFFLYAGTLQPRKNIESIVEAFRRLRAPKDWSLLLAGRRRPDYHPDWMRTPPAGVRYLGVLSDEDLAVLYRRASMFVSPSRYEGFGLTVLEAMASGCPVIAASNSSVPEVVGDAGVLLEQLDVGSIATAMETLASDEAARAELAQRGRERALQFDWQATARRMQSIYAEVAAHG